MLFATGPPKEEAAVCREVSSWATLIAAKRKEVMLTDKELSLATQAKELAAASFGGGLQRRAKRQKVDVDGASATPPAPGMEVNTSADPEVGDAVGVLTLKDGWVDGTVLEVSDSYLRGKRFRVHYDGWAHRYDAWVPEKIVSKRVDGSHDVTEVGENVEVLTFLHGWISSSVLKVSDSFASEKKILRALLRLCG